MIPLAVPHLAGREAEYLQDCITSGYVSSVGPFVEDFERRVAAAAGCEQSVATASGSAGLHAALTAVGVGRDDLVILPAFTFVGSASAIALCGAMPWLMDVTAEGWTLDPGQLSVALSRDAVRVDGAVVHRPSGRRVAAIMPVHVLGCPAEMEPIVAAAKEWGLPVVADGAAALGATYQDRAIASLGADLTVFSFNGNKTVTCGGGGAVAGHDPDLLGLVRHLTTTARVGQAYDHDRVGFNYRMTNLQAAVGCAQMEQLSRFVDAKRAIRQTYNEAFSGLSGVERFPDPPYARSACWFSGIVIDQQVDAAALQSRLRASGIDARPFWKPMHLQRPYAASPREDLRISDAIWARIVTLPCSVGLTPDDQQAVIAATKRALA